MNTAIVFVVLCLGVALAMPAGNDFVFKNNEKPAEMPQLYGGGGGNRQTGFNVDVGSKFPIWKSQNENHAVHGTAGYRQHLGGPYGNSQPEYRGGLQYTFRF